ncbi:MAG: aminotransferase class V-fold PLP-dependent enzyme, partial [Nanoarchaeota archaeon]
MNKKDFPLLNRKINGFNLVYLNSSATTQKPKIVIDSVKEFYEKFNANVHRDSSLLGNETEKIYNESRKKVADFLNSSMEEIVFTKSCTEAINIVAFGLNLKRGDKVVVTVANHHSNFVPWKILERRGVIVEILKVNKDGKIKFDIEKIKNAKILALTHLSNVLGNVVDVKKICDLAHEQKCLVLVDAAQSIGKMRIDVQELGCDFLTFSGHKMFAINGVGVLYGKKGLLEILRPLVYGGDMIKSVSFNKIEFAEVPRKFEGGTQNIAAVYSLGKAIDYID